MLKEAGGGKGLGGEIEVAGDNASSGPRVRGQNFHDI